MTDLFELPIAEGQALMSAHLRFDVSVNRTVEVLRIEIERELLPLEDGTPPDARIVEPCLAGRVQGGVYVPIVVDAFGQILEEIGAKVLHPAGVVDNQWNVLQVSKAPGINSGVPSEDEGVHPPPFGTRHPLRRGAKVHRFLIEPSTIRKGCGDEIVRELILRADHRGESPLAGKASPDGQDAESSRQVFGIPRYVRALVERVEALHVLSLQFEVEDGRVLSNAIWANRLRDDDEPMLQAPSNQDLSRCPSVLRGDLRNDRMVQPVSAREGAVGLQLHLLLHTELEQLLLVQEGMEFDLVHRGRNRRCGEQFLEVASRVVADADRAGEPVVVDLEQRLPRFVSQARYRPVDEIQIDVVEAAEFAATLLERPQGGLVAMVVVPELRRDEYLVPRDPALPHRDSKIAFVPVQLRGIEQAVSDLQGIRDRVPGRLPRAGLPHPEAQDGHPVPVVQRDARSEGQAHRCTDGTRATSTLTAGDFTTSECPSSGRRTASSPLWHRASLS